MPSRTEPTIHGPEAYLHAIRDSGQALRQQYMGKPVELAERFGLKLPKKPVQIMLDLGIITLEDVAEHGWDTSPGLRDLVVDVCTEETENAAVVGPRGGGKSQGVSFIEFYMVFLLLYDALNLGGSELQADQVYQYLLSYLNVDPYWLSLVRGDPMRERTYTHDDAWIRVLTASSKSVRSPHAGGRKPGGRLAGGLLVIDEEAEAEEEIVNAAMYTVDTARPSVSVRCSTFHNNVGSFADLMENYDEMGYRRYKWDIFDVAERCDCVEECQSAEKCFREDHIEKFMDPDTGQEVERLVHHAYCGGRAMYADGWIPVKEIEKVWRRGKRNHATFEVESMGSAPTSKGYVITSKRHFQNCATSEPGHLLYLPGWPTTITIDWGVSAAGLEVWQQQPNDRHVLLESEQLEEAGPTEAVAKISGLWNKYIDTIEEIAGDIGGGGNYMNKLLVEEYGFKVRDVPFAEYKESAAAALNVYNDNEKLVIPEENDIFIKQAKKWRRKNGRIVKGNDHMCDSSLCYFAKFVDQLGLSHIRVPGKAASTGERDPGTPGSAMPSVQTREVAASGNRVAVVVPFGRGGRN